MSKRACLALALFVFSMCGASSASAQAIDAGIDLFSTVDAVVIFGSTEVPAIPANFFYPGSDPFIGPVQFSGNPPGGSGFCPNDDTSIVDTVVRRPNPAPIPAPGNSAIIPIEIIELKLVSSQPIMVTGVNPPQEWWVEIELDPSPPGNGTMQRNDPNGGTFGGVIPIIPKMEFIPLVPGAPLQLPWVDPPLDMEFNFVPWENKPDDPNSCESNILFPAAFQLQTTGGNVVHTVIDNDQVSTKVPVAHGPWLALLTALVLFATLVRLRRSSV